MIHNLATQILLYYYNETGFGDPKVSACDPKVGRDIHFEKHWFAVFHYPVCNVETVLKYLFFTDRSCLGIPSRLSLS